MERAACTKKDKKGVKKIFLFLLFLLVLFFFFVVFNKLIRKMSNEEVLCNIPLLLCLNCAVLYKKKERKKMQRTSINSNININIK